MRAVRVNASGGGRSSVLAPGEEGSRLHHGSHGKVLDAMSRKKTETGTRSRLTPLLLAVFALLSPLGVFIPVALGDETSLFSGRLEAGNVIGEIRVQPGDTAAVDFCYMDPSDSIQGFTLTVCVSDELLGVPGSWDISGTYLEVVGAEYIQQQVDNDMTDGDGKEMIVGILLDALPPFEGQSMPPTQQPLSLGSCQFQIPPTVPCFSCFEVAFCDDIDATGSVLLSNRVVIGFRSVAPGEMLSSSICVPLQSLFVRGDVNNDAIVDIADVIYLLQYLFNNGQSIPCPDAADPDDDGLINISDALYIALYTLAGGMAPLSPFPDCGLEGIPDPDDLECTVEAGACSTCP